MSEIKSGTSIGHTENKVELPSERVSIGSRSDIRDSLFSKSQDAPQPATAPATDEIIAGLTRHNPEQLMKMYLTGKLTQGQLAHELKKYNDVVADTIIKESKEHKNTVIDYREVARANIANPGADLRPEQQHEAPHASTAKEAKKNADQSDNKRVKKEAEKQEDKLKAQEQHTRLIQQVNQQRQENEQKSSHIEREIDRDKKEQEASEDFEQRERQEAGLPEDLSPKPLRERLRSTISDEIRKELAKLMGGPGQQGS